MDVIVTKIPDGNNWLLADLLGRDMGRVLEVRPGVFMIQPAGNAVETLAAISSNPSPLWTTPWLRSKNTPGGNAAAGRNILQQGKLGKQT